MVFNEDKEYIKKKEVTQMKNMQKKLADLLLKNSGHKEEMWSIKHELTLRIENMPEVQFTEEDTRLLGKGIKNNQLERLIQKRSEEFTISCEQVIQSYEI